MPRYQITSPDGQKFEINAPEGATEDQALQYFQENMGGVEMPAQNVTAEVKKPQMSKTEAALRGAAFGAVQQPRDVIAAALASGMSPELGFDDALKQAREMSLEGKQGQAQQERPGYFTAGQVGGGVLSSILPASAATKAIGATAPALAKAPLVGNALSKLASGIGASRGIVGVPAAGSVQGGVSSLMTEGDLSGAGPGAAGAGAVGTLGKVMKPIADDAISAARKGFVNTLEKAGIKNLTAAQATGSGALEAIESVLAKLPLTAGAARKRAEDQLRKFTSAAMSFAGQKGDDISPEVRRVVEDTFNQRYKDLVDNEVVNIDAPVLQTIADISAKQLEKLPTNLKPIVQSYMKDIVQSGGRLTGEAYQAARSALTQQSRSIAISDPFSANVLRQLRNTLDEAAERSLPTNKVGAWRELNKQYANYKSIQKAATSVSKDSLEGILSPAALLRAVESANKTKGQKGYGELYGLARAGRGVLADTVPDSGTAQRLFYQNLVTGGLGAGTTGGATYAYTQDPEAAAITALVTLLGPKVAQSFLYSKAGKAYLTKGLPLGGAVSSKAAKTLAATGGGVANE